VSAAVASWCFSGGLVTVRQRPESAKGTVFLHARGRMGCRKTSWLSRALDEQFREAVRHATFLLVHGRIERDGAQINIVGQRFSPLHDGDPESFVHQSHDFR